MQWVAHVGLKTSKSNKLLGLEVMTNFVDLSFIKNCSRHKGINLGADLSLALVGSFVYPAET